MKGQTGIELAMLAIMGMVGVIAIYMPSITFKASSSINIQYEYNYDNSQLLMMSLLSTTVQDKPSMEILGEYMQLESKPDTGILNERLEAMAKAVKLDCYRLSGDEDIAKSSCDPSKYKVSANIPLPYKPDNLVKTVTLVVGK
jgi:hypothetical protein